MKHTNHILRLVIILALIVAGFFAARGILVPDSFGTYGSYSYGYHRGNSDAEQAGLPPLFQGSGKCSKCHEEQFRSWQDAGHKTVGCESCHGNWQAHNNNTKDQVTKDASTDACLLCHQKLTARPADFPQITNFAQHVSEQDVELEKDMNCMECHDPHEPM